MIYLIHLERKFHHAQHYLGSVQGGMEELQKRLERHRSGQGARLLRAVNEQGIAWAVVRTWEGGRKEERSLKKLRNIRRLCPVCRDTFLSHRREYLRLWNQKRKKNVQTDSHAE